MHDAQSHYLETQILTATPQKLRLMLIEGATRLLHQARLAFDEGNATLFADKMERSRDIIVELLSSIRSEKTPLNESVRRLYGFLFHSLGEAQLLRDAKRIDDALRILEEERETWRQVCEVMPEAPIADEESAFRSQEIAAPAFKEMPQTTASFSFEA